MTISSLKSVLLALTAGTVIFAGLPAAAWGLGDMPGFFSSYARTGYVLVIVALQCFGAIYHPQAGRKPEQRKNGQTRQKIDLYLIQAFSLLVVLCAPFSDRHAIGILDVGEAFRLSGLLPVGFGFIFMLAAEKRLDRQFSVEVTLQENHRLIQSGPYAMIRHPRYLGIFALFLGISLVFRSLLSLGVVAALSIVLVWRMFAEDALMKREFGEEWDAYFKRSWRVIPFVF